jgi:hypothetical protein
LGKLVEERHVKDVSARQDEKQKQMRESDQPGTADKIVAMQGS